MSGNLKILLIIGSVLLVGGGVGLLARESFREDVEFYVHVEDVVKDPAKWVGKKTIQVHGYARNVPLKPTLKDQVVSRDFELESKGSIIQVHHEGTVPDVFKEQAETVVKGSLSQLPDGKILLTTIGGEQGIMAKCPSKYQGK
jgi:cytochrome c-type biogenesis protein CcmE